MENKIEKRFKRVSCNASTKKSTKGVPYQKSCHINRLYTFFSAPFLFLRKENSKIKGGIIILTLFSAGKKNYKKEKKILIFKF